MFNVGALPVPVWATAAVAALGIGGVFFTYNLKPGAVPVAVVLTATRGGSTQAVKAAGPLDLDMDARDLASSGTYRVQVVNGDGAEVWTGSSDTQNGRVHALVQKRFSPGQYYVRIADPAGQRREFALRLGN